MYIIVYTYPHIRFEKQKTFMNIHMLLVLPHSELRAQECERSVDLLRSQLPIVGGFFSPSAARRPLATGESGDVESGKLKLRKIVGWESNDGTPGTLCAVSQDPIGWEKSTGKSKMTIA